MSAPRPDEPLQGGAGELWRHFARGEKPVSCHRVGLEHEKIAVFPDGRAPDHGVIAGILEGLVAVGGWERVDEGGALIGLRRGRSTVSLEPGGQIELSDEPRPSAQATAEGLHAHLAELLPLVDQAGLRLLGLGFRPFGTLEEVPWMPKGRYRVMREYLPGRGALAHEMMKRTATVQANFDYSSQADCAAKMRLAMGVTSLVTALFAASSLVDGRPSGYQSYRARAWLDTDDDRCGLLPFAFAPEAPERLYRDYAAWALEVPMFFVYRDGYRPAGGISFRRFLDEGFGGERATAADWELHLSTLFPEVRLKQYLEVRGADAGPLSMVTALPALYRGLLYDPEAQAAAWDLVADWSFDERVGLRLEVPRTGLRAQVRGQAIQGRCVELVRIARQGLIRLGDDDPDLLGPLEALAASGLSVADRAVETYQRLGGDRAALVEALRLA